MDNATIKQATEMRKAHLNLAKYVLDKGYSVSVDYGEGNEDECNFSTDYNQIKENVEACDEAYMRIYNKDKKYCGSAWVIFGNEDNELVADYTVCPLLDDWSAQFETMYEETE